MFGSIQCDRANDGDWGQCERTLYSQTGLSFIVGAYTTIKILTGVVPKKILDKHTVSLKDVLGVTMDVEAVVQFLGLAGASVFALYLFGNYGAKGKIQR